MMFRQTSLNRICLVLCLLALPAAGRGADSVVVFNEIMYHPDGDETGREWIEIYNQMAVDVDLSSWSIRGGVDFDFPKGAVLRGREFLVIGTPDAALSGESDYSSIIGPFEGRLGNGGEELRLVNHTGRVMDTLDYDDEAPWPLAPDGSGYSLAKAYPDAASGPPENWSASARVGGTPGYLNFAVEPIAEGFVRLVEPGNEARYHVPTSDALGTSWTLTDFADSTWPCGHTGVGYEQRPALTTNYSRYVHLDNEEAMYDKNLTCYVRVPFDVIDPARLSSLTLRMRYHGGFVAYLNGTEIARANVRSPLGWNSGARSAHLGAKALTFEVFDVSAHGALLRKGRNVLALQGLNDEIDSPDYLIQPDLQAFRPSAAERIVLSEVAGLGGSGAFWIELANEGPHTVDLSGYALMLAGMEPSEAFLASGSLAPGARAVFGESALGFTPAVGDQLFFYEPGLSRLKAAAALGEEARAKSLDLSNPWAVPSAPTPHEPNVFDFHDAIVINEILYHHRPDYGPPFVESDEEWIEIYNRSAEAVDLADWQLAGAVRYMFALGARLEAGAYAVVARDAAAVRLKYPEADVYGDYAGGLSNSDERIALVDATGNVADEVHYYDDRPWPNYADGGGSSLELRDPDSDNSAAEAWAASREDLKSEWRHYSYEGVAKAPRYDPVDFFPFHEFQMGLLDAGEALFDNMTVRALYTTGSVSLLQNGTFDGDEVGAEAAKWRIQGTHDSSRVVEDPDEPGSRVLHLKASARSNYLSNHAETTLANGHEIEDGTSYTIAFDAKWLGGSPQLRTELYFNDVVRKTILAMPERCGTPGARNSVYEENVGPTYADFIHSPIVPGPNDSVQVTVRASDPDGVTTMTLWYARDGVAWSSVTMQTGANGLISGTVPPYPNDAVVQFYVEGRDGLGAVSTCPALGRDSRATYQVDRDFALPALNWDFRFSMIDSDIRYLHEATNMMSNKRLGATVVYDGREVFYDVLVRLRGSMFSRNGTSDRLGYNLSFPASHLFRGVQKTVTVRGFAREEFDAKFMVLQAGLPGMYDDLVRLRTTRRYGDGIVVLSMARYGDVFLESQYENGADGTTFKMEGLRTLIATVDGKPEGLKLFQPIRDTAGFDLTDMGDDPEQYRWHLPINRNRAKDDYSGIVAMCKSFDLEGEALRREMDKTIDVDEWLRLFALQSLVNPPDVYGGGSMHNFFMYTRPSDGRVLAMQWDWDFAFGNSATDSPINVAQNIGKLIKTPGVRRQYYGQIRDLIQTVYNREYMQYWTDSFGPVAGMSYAGDLSYIETRGNYVLENLPEGIPFEVLSCTKEPDGATAIGRGWIDVREIRLAGSDAPLDVYWVDDETWRAAVPDAPAEGALEFVAYDFHDKSVGSGSIEIGKSRASGGWILY